MTARKMVVSPLRLHLVSVTLSASKLQLVSRRILRRATARAVIVPKRFLAWYCFENRPWPIQKLAFDQIVQISHFADLSNAYHLIPVW